MEHLHQYTATTKWVGNRGKGTSDYKAYDRNHNIEIDGKPTLLCSSDPDFRGDKSRVSPEDLLVCSLSGCHMLWYLHLCAINGVVVTEYIDYAHGHMRENSDGSGEFTEVTLNPKVTVTETGMIKKANELHHEANSMCFIARSVKFPVIHKPVIVSSLKEV